MSTQVRLPLLSCLLVIFLLSVSMVDGIVHPVISKDEFQVSPPCRPMIVYGDITYAESVVNSDEPDAPESPYVSAGTILAAYIDGKSVSNTNVYVEEGLSSFVLEVDLGVTELDPECSMENQIILKIPRYVAVETINWQPGFVGQQNLTMVPDTIPVSIPEPATVVLLSTGLVGLLAFRNRYRRLGD